MFKVRIIKQKLQYFLITEKNQTHERERQTHTLQFKSSVSV